MELDKYDKDIIDYLTSVHTASAGTKFPTYWFDSTDFCDRYDLTNEQFGEIYGYRGYIALYPTHVRDLNAVYITNEPNGIWEDNGELCELERVSMKEAKRKMAKIFVDTEAILKCLTLPDTWFRYK